MRAPTGPAPITSAFLGLSVTISGIVCDVFVLMRSEVERKLIWMSNYADKEVKIDDKCEMTQRSRDKLFQV